MAAPEIARSPYLSAGPVPERRWTRRRLIWCVAVFVIASLFCIGTATEFFHPDGHGFYLYWLHDNIYLPLKGYFWTLNYPDRLWIWATLLTAILIWLPFFVLHRSASQWVHRKTLRAALHWPLVRRVAVRWTSALRGTALRPVFLENYVENECRRLLQTIDQSARSSPRDLRYFAALVAFRTDLDERGTLERLQDASWLIDAILRLQVYGTPELRRGDEMTALWRRLHGTVASAAGEDEPPEIHDIYRDTPLAPKDLETFVAWHIGAAAGAFGPADALSRPLARSKGVLTRDAISGLEALRRLLAASREPGRLARGRADERAYRPEAAAMIGRAAGQLALLSAVMLRDSALALGYFDSVETARFEILLGGLETAIAADDPVIGLTGDPETPSPGDYSICARLMEAESSARRRSLLRRTDREQEPLADVLEESDLMRIDREAARLRQAAARDAADPQGSATRGGAQ